MSEATLPDLTFPMVRFRARQTPWDLVCLLYLGGAAAKADQLHSLIHSGDIGRPLRDRIALVMRIHAELTGFLVGGGSKETAKNNIYGMRRFFAWADDVGHVMTIETIADAFVRWSDFLTHRQRVVHDLQEIGAYQLAKSAACVLDKALERRVSILANTRIHKPRHNRLVGAFTSSKQTLAESLQFGHALVGICDALTVDAIDGPLPVQIAFQSGTVIDGKSNEARLDLKKSRSRLVNLRVEAELLLFIAQTGLNTAQVSRATIDDFHYTSHLDGYQIRRFKHRRQGEVEFEIYREYRSLFERYLTWRAVMFAEEPAGLLFPFAGPAGLEGVPPTFCRVRAACRKLGVYYVPPQRLRKIRINWLLRELQDVALAAEMAQHGQETLLRNYLEPNAQIAMVEISRFHQSTDPDVAIPGPGRCVCPEPSPLPGAPSGAPVPDCTSAAGCLFCIHHRDIDSQDHVWSLATFRHLKSLELTHGPPSRSSRTAHVVHPAALAVDRLTAKLRFYELSNITRERWVREALLRVEEGAYHPAWRGYIRMHEEGDS